MKISTENGRLELIEIVLLEKKIPTVFHLPPLLVALFNFVELNAIVTPYPLWGVLGVNTQRFEISKGTLPPMGVLGLKTLEPYPLKGVLGFLWKI